MIGASVLAPPDKEFVYLKGETDSGKTTMTGMFANALGQAVSTPAPIADESVFMKTALWRSLPTTSDMPSNWTRSYQFALYQRPGAGRTLIRTEQSQAACRRDGYVKRSGRYTRRKRTGHCRAGYNLDYVEQGVASCTLCGRGVRQSAAAGTSIEKPKTVDKRQATANPHVCMERILGARAGGVCACAGNPRNASWVYRTRQARRTVASRTLRQAEARAETNPRPLGLGRPQYQVKTSRIPPTKKYAPETWTGDTLLSSDAFEDAYADAFAYAQDGGFMEEVTQRGKEESSDAVAVRQSEQGET